MRTSQPPRTLCKQEGEVSVFPLIAINNIVTNHGLLSLGQVYVLSVQFSRSVMSDSLWPRGLQHTRLPCPSSTLRDCSNSCPSSWWCHSTISSSVVPFSSCLQFFPASGSFPMNQFFTSGGQSIGVSASASVLPMNIQDWFPLGLTYLIFLKSSPMPQFKNINSSALSLKN